MSDDILDLFAGRKPAKPAPKAADASKQAPIELMSQVRKLNLRPWNFNNIPFCSFYC